MMSTTADSVPPESGGQQNDPPPQLDDGQDQTEKRLSPVNADPPDDSALGEPEGMTEAKNDDVDETTEAPATAAVEEEPKGPAPSASLDFPIPYLDGKVDGVEMFYRSVPEDVADFDWMDVSRLQTIFPPRVIPKNGRKLGARQIPMALLIDAKSDHDKLVVVNWWRGMTSAEQADESKSLRGFYRAPTRSNDLLPAKFFAELKTGYKKPITRGEMPMASPENGGTASTEQQNLQQQDDYGRKSETNWTFRTISTARELADNLSLPVPALYCAELDGNHVCDVEGCHYPALLRNRAKCCVHCRNWYPKEGYTRGGRGYLLLGPQYTNRKSFDPLCVCGDETCNSIGYSSNMVRLPPLEDLRGQILQSIGLDIEDPSKKAIIRQIHAKAYIAPWHFHPEHRTMQYDGTWKVVKFQKKDTFADPSDENGSLKWVGFPPPTYDPKTFLEKEVNASRGRGHILPESLVDGLPDWIEAYRNKEEGPLTMMERHNKELRMERAELCQEIMERDKRNELLEEENKKLREELAQAKNQRRKAVAARKRKRSRKSNADKMDKRKKKLMSPTTMATMRAGALTTPEKEDEDDIFDEGDNDSSSDDDDDGGNEDMVGDYHPGLHHAGGPAYHPGHLFHHVPNPYHASHNGEPHHHQHSQVNAQQHHMQTAPDQLHHHPHSLAHLSDQAHNYQVRWS